MIDDKTKKNAEYKAMGGNQEGGYVFGYGVNLPKEIVDTPAMEQAYIMGREI